MPSGMNPSVVRRRLIWNLAAAGLFVTLAIVLSVSAWVRAVLVVAAVLELGFAALVRRVLARHQSAR